MSTLYSFDSLYKAFFTIILFCIFANLMLSLLLIDAVVGLTLFGISVLLYTSLVAVIYY